jgi:hypothetical protein
MEVVVSPWKARKECQRPTSLKGEPDGGAGAVGKRFVLRERRERHDASVFDAEPSSPMRRQNVANVRHAGIAVLACQDLERRRHASARDDKFAALEPIADNRREIVREDAGQRRHVADIAAHRAREIADRPWPFGHRVQIATFCLSGFLDHAPVRTTQPAFSVQRASAENPPTEQRPQWLAEASAPVSYGLNGKGHVSSPVRCSPHQVDLGRLRESRSDRLHRPLLHEPRRAALAVDPGMRAAGDDRLVDGRERHGLAPVPRGGDGHNA